MKKSTALRRLYYRIRMLRASSQSDEEKIIAGLVRDAPRTFVEFGFHPIEFNCAALARDKDWQGLLIDGSSTQVSDAIAIMPARVKAVEAFLTLENIDFIKSAFPRLGILSIDVDGNDYWFLEKLIDAHPSVICVEYNSTLGLEPITVPYDSSFDRHVKHPSGWYHGASLPALTKLCARHGYGLAAVSEAGLNAFFTKTGKLDPVSTWRPNRLRHEMSGKSQAEQWQAIQHMPFVTIPG
ncbi:MAG: hypothetical protein ABIL01_33755 [Pseudomonadota bacterium]